MLKKLKIFWESYKYRFVPWIAANLNTRSARTVEASVDEVLSHVQVKSSLLKLFRALHKNEQFPELQSFNEGCYKGNYSRSTEECHKHHLRENNENFQWRRGDDSGSISDESLNRSFTFSALNSPTTETLTRGSLEQISKFSAPKSSDLSQSGQASQHVRQCRKTPSDVMSKTFGFSVYRAQSSLENVGTGVFVSGVVPEYHVVAMYPGTIYLPYEPILIQSVGNPFIFRCSDGLLIDGFNRRLSKAIYRSCSRRDRIAPDLQSSDLSWVTEELQNPLNVGQYVNNHTEELGANVAYQEYDVHQDFPLELRKYLPNAFYNAGQLHQRPLRTIVLISLREIQAGEELLSSYFTLIH